MHEVVTAKFWQNKLFLRKLLDTQPMYIEEDNMWHDNFWGNCHCPQCAGKIGQNHLGKILMQIRDETNSNEIPENQNESV